MSNTLARVCYVKDFSLQPMDALYSNVPTFTPIESLEQKYSITGLSGALQ